MHISAETQITFGLNTLPFVTLNTQWLGPDAYPSTSVGATAQLVQSIRMEGATIHFNIAVAQMEAGNLKTQPNRFGEPFNNRTSPYRPLLAVLSGMPDERIHRFESRTTDDRRNRRDCRTRRPRMTIPTKSPGQSRFEGRIIDCRIRSDLENLRISSLDDGQ